MTLKIWGFQEPVNSNDLNLNFVGLDLRVRGVEQSDGSGPVLVDNTTIVKAPDGTLSVPGKNATGFNVKTTITGNELVFAYDSSIPDWVLIQASLIKGSGSTSQTVTTAASGSAYNLALPASGGVKVYDLSLSANCTLTLSGASTGFDQIARVFLRQSSSGPYTVTWPNNVVWANGQVPTMPTASGSALRVEFETPDGGATIFGRY